MSTQTELSRLIAKTTIYLIVDNSYNPIFGNKKTSRFQTDPGVPQTIESLEPIWKSIFDKYGNQWNTERQLFRLLYDQIRLFITSFTFLRVYKVKLLESRMRDENAFNQFANCLASMYLFGKKATDLIKEIDKNKSKTSFSTNFSNTRNLLFEHNYAPYLLKDYIVEPSFFNSSGSSSELVINLHTQSDESVYHAYADYYEDYYKLENELISWLKTKQ